MAKQEFGQLSHYWGGIPSTLVGRFGSRKYNGHSVLWDGGVTAGMKATDVPWYYKGGDKDDVISTGLWSLGRNQKPKVIRAPKLWLQQLPQNAPVHGELWNNDDLEYVKSHGRKHNPSYAGWRQMQLLVFGVKPYSMWKGIESIVPMEQMQWFWKALPQEQYLTVLMMGMDTKDPCDDKERTINPVRIVKQTKLNSISQVMDLFTEFKDTKWEGLMFCDLTKPYETQRSYNSLKYKPKYETEGEVIGYEDGKTGVRIGGVAGIRIRFTWDEKVSSIHGGTDDMVGKEVELTVSGLCEEEWDRSACATKYPVGSLLSFTFLVISGSGCPQSPNIDREVHV